MGRCSGTRSLRRADRALALAAVAQTGLALQFCDRHQEDEELAAGLQVHSHALVSSKSHPHRRVGI